MSSTRRSARTWLCCRSGVRCTTKTQSCRPAATRATCCSVEDGRTGHLRAAPLDGGLLLLPLLFACATVPRTTRQDIDQGEPAQVADRIGGAPSRVRRAWPTRGSTGTGTLGSATRSRDGTTLVSVDSSPRTRSSGTSRTRTRCRRLGMRMGIRWRSPMPLGPFPRRSTSRRTRRQRWRKRAPRGAPPAKRTAGRGWARRCAGS
jgi:hypothetical protein